MTEDSIDFKPLPTNILSDAKVRHSFRVPVSNKEKVVAIFSGKTYCVTDVSINGIAIHSDSCIDFEAGQVIEDAEFRIGSHRFTGLKGTVMHCSAHNDGNLKFGIEWLYMSLKDSASLKSILNRKKASALKKNQPPYDQTSEKS